MFALYATVAHTRAARWAITGLVTTVVGAGCLLVGGGYAVFVMPAAGVLIGQGRDQNVLRLLDQVFAEPGLIPVFLGGFVFSIGLLVTSIAVWRRVRCPAGRLCCWLQRRWLACPPSSTSPHQRELAPPSGSRHLLPWRSMSSATREWPDPLQLEEGRPCGLHSSHCEVSENPGRQSHEVQGGGGSRPGADQERSRGSVVGLALERGRDGVRSSMRNTRTQAAVMTHIANLGPLFGMLLDVGGGCTFEVFGNPASQLGEAKAGLDLSVLPSHFQGK